jgi:O-antigen ligase
VTRPLALTLRLCAGGVLAWITTVALTAPELGLAAKVAAATVVAATVWTPLAGLVATLALASAGALFAAPPARTVELLAWAFLAAWLLAVWRPLSDGRRPTRAVVAVGLYAICAVSSWLAYTLGGAAGVDALMIPAFVARAIPVDHLVVPSPETETLTLLPLLAGLGVFAASATIARTTPRAAMTVAVTVAVSAAVLSALTIVDVLRQWSGYGEFGAWFLLRYVQGERFSLHLQDLNAAGSQYLLGGLVAISLALVDRARRTLWIALATLIAPSLWISGSRSASLGALVVGCSVIPLARRAGRIRIAPAHVVLTLALLAAVAVGGGVLASAPAEQGTASNALRLRSQFLVTSARMFASAPVFGVGIGHYHERSNQFMPASLREVYRHENAHNYFAQQFAELGILGGLLFVWLVVVVVRAGWQAVRDTAGADAATLGLLAGTSGYLLTCVTGHPLLVPEAAVPFWGAFGVLAGASEIRRSGDSTGRSGDSTGRSGDQEESTGRSGDQEGKGRTLRWIVIAVVVAALANVALQARRAALTRERPGERGFYALEKTSDGIPFVWMTRRGVFYENPQPGTLIVPLQAPSAADTPFKVAVEVGGRRTGVYEVAPGRWTLVEIPVRDRAASPFRRIDLRADRTWLGEDGEPRSVMVGTTRLIPAGGR